MSVLNTCGEIGAKLAHEFVTAPDNAHHLSTTSATEFLECLGAVVREQVRKVIAQSEMFSLLADECIDVNNTERLSVSLRVLTKDAVREVFLACPSLPDTTAATIHNTIMAVLHHNNLDLSKCVAVSFEGAANFSGVRGGVQALLRKEHPRIFYVH